MAPLFTFIQRVLTRCIRLPLYCYILLILCITVTEQLYPQVNRWRSIGYEFIQNQEYEKALSFFTQAIYASPQNGAIRAEYAYALQLLKRFEESLTEYTIALGLFDAPVADIKYNMALIRMQQGEYIKARGLFNEVLSINPEDLGAYLNRANSSLNLKNYAEALDDYRYYIEADPASEERQDIEQLIALLDKVKGFPSSNIDKAQLQEKQRLEEELNRIKKKLEEAQNIQTPSSENENQYLLPLR